MIKVEPIQAFSGFGAGGSQGEYFHSQGMQKSQFGVATKWAISTEADKSVLTNLALANWFTQGKFSGNPFVYSFDSNGRLYRTALGPGSWSEQRHVTGVSSHGNGLIFDQKNRLLYANDNKLGMSSDGITFTDNWQDLVITTTDLRPMETFEDLVLIGNTNQIAILNVDDDSFNANGFDMPTGFTCRCIRAGQNGILMGFNFNNKGVLVLWDGNSLRSIAPWIWRNSNILSIIPTDIYYGGWIVFTSQEIFFTNGYYVRPITSNFPDHLIHDQSILSNLLPQGVDSQGDNLFFWGTHSRFNRQKSGVYILNLTTGLFEFAAVANGVTYGLTSGAIFYDNLNFIHLSYTTPTPDNKFLGILSNFSPATASLITEELGQSDNEKVAEAVKLTLGLSSYQVLTPAVNFDVSVKVANARRNIFTWAETNLASTQADQIRIDGSVATVNGSNKAEIGDEVTILQGINAGQVRHIISIANQGTNTETWTLDSVLSGNTEQFVFLNVSPFKLARKYTFADPNELREFFFDLQDRLKGKKFLVKVLLENITTGLMVEIKGGQFIYDELTVKR